MSRYSELMQRIRAGECILIDGATGTEIERRGVPQLDNAWNGGGALSHPLVLREVHEEYLQIGAEIIISNNFATHYYAQNRGTHTFGVAHPAPLQLDICARSGLDRTCSERVFPCEYLRMRNEGAPVKH